jgi:hypothetical protein
MRGWHPVIRTGRDLVSEAILTKLAFFHWIRRTKEPSLETGERKGSNLYERF